MELRDLFRNWKIWLVIVVVIIAVGAILINGLQFGVDFSGGTMFQIHLSEKASQDQLSSIRNTIEQRIDWTGLKDTTVTIWGDEFIVAQTAETNPDTIEKMEALLKKQGKFEVTLNGDLLFNGEDIINISKDAAKGYGIRQASETSYEWFLPFVLKESAAKNFSTKIFHKCTIVSFDATAGKQYDCEKTYFFIDRPDRSIIIVPQDYYLLDQQLLLQGNRNANIPQGSEFDELMRNAAMPYFIYDQNFSAEQLQDLQKYKADYESAIIPAGASNEIKQTLEGLGYKIIEISPRNENYAKALNNTLFSTEEFAALVPWTWEISGAKQVISLSEDVTNLEPYVERPEQGKIFSELLIRGYANTAEEAQTSIDDLTIILESGSLPIPVDNISKETISPLLGKEFMASALIMGVIAAIVVAIVLFIHYRNLLLACPIIIIGTLEIIIILGFAALIKWNLDLGSIAGIVTSVGTGVNDQIVITDEMTRDREEEQTGSLVARIKRAFFIVFAAGATIIAAMLPIILFGFGMGKLVGFAITSIVGVLIGIFITRPAYAEIARYVLTKVKKN